MQQLDNHIDYVEMDVSDIGRAKAFYGGVFGWTFVDYGEEYCEFNDGRMKGGFSLSDRVETRGPLIVLYHSDLENLVTRIEAHGGKITREKFQFPGGERIEFSDPDGHVLAAWRTI